MAARDTVEEAFGDLCATHGKLAAVTGGSWIDIAVYRPTYMDNYKAHKKKKDAVVDARILLRIMKNKDVRAERIKSRMPQQQ